MASESIAHSAFGLIGVINCDCSCRSSNFRQIETTTNQKSIDCEKDVTKTGNGERGAGSGERKSGNELSAETSIKIQYGR